MFWLSLQKKENNSYKNTTKIAESEGEQLNLFCDIHDVPYCHHTLLLYLTFFVLKILFHRIATLVSFFNLFGDSRDEAVRLLDEFTRTGTAMPELREELFQQLSTLYIDQVGDSGSYRIVDALINASYLNIVQVLLPRTGVRVENQAVNSDSPLTDSMNSNQQQRTVGVAVNTESGEVESFSSMSFIEARTHFETKQRVVKFGCKYIQ